MPTQRFFNLPQEKQDRILNAALEEMARVPYAEVSINRIVHSADIARGSFYQYFEGKDDLLTHLMRGFGVALRHRMDESLEETGGDLFVMLRDVVGFVAEFGTRPENLDVCRNLFSAVVPCAGGTCFAFLKLDPAAEWAALRPRLDLHNFKNTDDESMLRLVYVLIALFGMAVMHLFRAPEEKDTALSELERVLEMLKYGVLKGEVDA